MSAPQVDEPFEDSRRLTGANLYFDGPGAALETAHGLAFDADALQRWRNNIARLRGVLGWPAGAIFARQHVSGASLAFEAPFDQLYIAAEANEWAWYAALGLRADDTPVAADEGVAPRQHIAHFDDEEALRQLRVLAATESKPALRALVDAAGMHATPAHADDDALSIGEGEHAQTWALTSLPSPTDVTWQDLRAIPKAVVTGSNGKTTTVRLVAAMLRAQGRRAGYSSTDGLFIDGERVEAGDYSGPVGARTVLRDARVQVAVLETARGGLLRRGLAARDARVAVVTNVSADHFGEYGVHTLDDIAAVKLVVAKSLAPDGVLVLNADDAMLAKHAPSAKVSRIGWFALDLDDASRRGTLACGVRDGCLLLRCGHIEHDLGDVSVMPLTLGGSARYNLANIAAATLVAQALGVAPGTIASVLSRFGAANADNPGRLQRWQLGDVQVLLDYAHNPDGLRGLLQVAVGLRGAGRLALLLGQAGNRLDDDVRALAQVAAAAEPDCIWLKDIAGEYLRGKQSGQVAALLHESLQAAGLCDDALRVCLDEAEAARQALAWARAGDLLVLPVHEPARRDAVVALLDQLHATGWRAGQALPPSP